MTGQITGREEFIIASFVVSALVFAGLTVWSWARLERAKKKLKMLEASEEN